MPSQWIRCGSVVFPASVDSTVNDVCAAVPRVGPSTVAATAAIAVTDTRMTAERTAPSLRSRVGLRIMSLLPTRLRAPVVDEDQAGLVVCDLAGVADEEVRCDEAFGICELARSAFDFVDADAVPQI